MCAVAATTGCISPVHRPLLLCAFRKKNWKCLVISMLIYACLVASLTCWLHRQELEDTGTGCLRTHSFIPLSLFLMFYVIYLIECWRNAPVLQPFVSQTSVQQHIHLIRHAAPVIWWRVVCYHFVRRSRQIVRYRNGVPNTTTQVFYERTNSHVDEQEFDYSSCGVRDVSYDVINLEKHSLVVIDFAKCFSFSNLECENQYLGQRCDFFRSNEGWDSFLEAKEGMKLRNVDWKDQFVVCEDPENPPFYACRQFYWLCSVFLASWFLRVYLDYKAAIVNYQVEKLFGGSPPLASSEHTWNPLARVATMDSTEMEWQIQTNQLVAPTYEQATGEDAEQAIEVPASSRTSVGNPQLQRRYAAAERPAMHRTRSWAREGRRYGIMTTFRRSMSQLFGRNIPDEDDDVNLLPNSPHRQTFHPDAARPLSEAPPTYSEAMALHRILGFYDENNHHEEYDITRSDCNLHRVNGDGVAGGANRPVSKFKFYRRKRPTNLRVRSQYRPTSSSITPTSRPRSSYVSRDIITGPAAVSHSVGPSGCATSVSAGNLEHAPAPDDASDSDAPDSVNTILSNAAAADCERTPIVDSISRDNIAEMATTSGNGHAPSPSATYGTMNANVPTSI